MDCGYYGFHLSIVKIPPKIKKFWIKSKNGSISKNDKFYKEINKFAEEVANSCISYSETDEWFPIIGEKLCSYSEGYGYGHQNKLIPSILKFAQKFIGTTFTLYHYYNNFNILDIYTFNSQKLIRLDSTSINPLKIGPYEICASFDFMNTTVPNNITCFINIYYKWGFFWEFHKKPIVENIQ